MELHRDVMFKRNIYGYVEETRVQVWLTNIRQIPMWIVYHPHNQEYDTADVLEHGLYFLNADNVISHIERFYHAFQTDSEYVVLRDLCEEAIEALRKSKPKPDGLMYRVIYHNPLADFPTCAIGCGPYDLDQPRFVNSETYDTGHWCIYNCDVASAVATMNASTPYGGYIHERIRNNPPGGMFIVQATPYNESGSPKEGESWTIVNEYPQWNRNVYLVFSKDLSAVETIYEANRY